MAFKALNNSASPNSLIFTLLVFRVYSQLINTNALLPTVSQRVNALKKVMEEIKNL